MITDAALRERRADAWRRFAIDAELIRSDERFTPVERQGIIIARSMTWRGYAENELLYMPRPIDDVLNETLRAVGRLSASPNHPDWHPSHREIL